MYLSNALIKNKEIYNFTIIHYYFNKQFKDLIVILNSYQNNSLFVLSYTMTQELVFESKHLPTFTPVLNKDSKAYLWYQGLNSPKYIIAPMVNQSELAFRLLCSRYGAHLAYTPMYHSKLFIQFESYRKEQFETCMGDSPIIAQFCCNNAETMIEAVTLCQEKERRDWELNYIEGKRRYGYLKASGCVRQLESKSIFEKKQNRETIDPVNQDEENLIRRNREEDTENEEYEEIDDPYLQTFKSNIVGIDL